MGRAVAQNGTECSVAHMGLEIGTCLVFDVAFSLQNVGERFVGRKHQMLLVAGLFKSSPI